MRHASCLHTGLALLALALTPILPAAPLGTAFTYQGRLQQGGTLANGMYDLRFTLYDASVDGNAAGAAVTSAGTGVTNGLFTVTLDFGNVFSGNALWLEIATRTNGAGSFTTLTPRQALAPAPYALQAASALNATTAASANSVAAANISGLIPLAQLSGAVVTNGSSGVNLSGNFAGNGAGLTTLNGAAIAASTVTGSQIASNTITSANVAEGTLTAQDFTNTTRIGLIQVLEPIPVANDRFGCSVASVGTNRFVVGASGKTLGGNSGAGEAYLYDTSGVLVTTLTNPAAQAGGSFGWSVAGVGASRIVVGAYSNRCNGAMSGAGEAYLFDTTGAWVTTITNPAPAAADNFGYSVAGVGTNQFVIGAWRKTVGGNSFAGQAYLYDASGTLMATITNPAPAAADYFGCSVAGVGTNRFVIGACNKTLGGNNFAGQAYLYDTSGALVTTITNPAPSTSDLFGSSVAGVGTDRFLIGAQGQPVGVDTYVGQAYLYDRNGTLLSTITNPAPAGGDQFGSCVRAVGSNGFVIGAYGKMIGGKPYVGQAYLYDGAGTLVATITNPAPAASDYFGKAMAGVGTNQVVIGAYGKTLGVNSRSGQAYLSATVVSMPGLVADSIAPGSVGLQQLDVNSLDTRYATLASIPSIAPGSVGLQQLDVNSVDTRYILKTGDSMTGRLNLGAGIAGDGSGLTNLSFTGSLAGDVAGPQSATLISAGAVNSTKLASDATSLAKVSGGAMTSVGGNVGIGTNNPQNALHVVGTVQANGFSGPGGGLTGLNASQLTSGTVPLAQLPSAVVTNNESNPIFNGLTVKNDLLGVDVQASDALYVDTANENNGGLNPGLNFGHTSEGIGSKRTPGGNQNGLDFFTANTSRMSITSSGNVGIGTNNPQSALHVVGTVQANGFSGSGGGLTGLNASQLTSGTVPLAQLPSTVVTNDQSHNVSVAQLFASLAVTGGELMAESGIYVDTFKVNSGGLNPGLMFGSYTEGIASKRTVGGNQNGLDFYTAQTPRMSIANGGNVGIGTNNPQSALHVVGTVQANGFSGPGGGLTGLNASQLTGGPLPLAQLPGAVVTNLETGVTLSGTFSGNGAGLTGLNAGNLSVGMLADGQLSANIARLNANQTFSGANAFAGALSLSNAIQAYTNIFMNDRDVQFRNDGFHGLGWYGSSKLFAGNNVNGPVLYGGGGGALGYTGNGTNISLSWDSSKNVSIGGSLSVATNLTVSGSATVSGNVRLNDKTLWLRAGTDQNHGLGWFGSGSFAGANPDGPVLFGCSGGALGTACSGQTIALAWNQSGNVGIGTTSPTNRLHVIGGATFASGSAGANQAVVWTPGSASWSFTSDRNAKAAVQPVDTQAVLQKVARLPINEWNYTGYEQRHIGPMAQDFHAAFPLNDSDTRLNDADLHGVALAAIQGLNQKLEAKNAALEKQLQARDAELDALKHRLEVLERHQPVGQLP